MHRYGPLAAGVALVVLVTVVHGALTLRWKKGAPEALAAMADRYKSIPMTIGNGDWVGEDTKQDERVMVAAGAKAAITRRYRNLKTKRVVQVFLVCGMTRDTAVHTPDACYPNQGYKKELPITDVELPTGNTKSSFYATTFSKPTSEGLINQRIYWTWNGGDGWRAPKFPRVAYRPTAPLNKLYLIASAPTLEELKAADNAELAQFANVFLPEVDRILNPPPTAEAKE